MKKKKRPSGHAQTLAAGLVPVMLRMPREVVAAIDRARGVVPRATYITQRVIESMETPDDRQR